MSELPPRQKVKDCVNELRRCSGGVARFSIAAFRAIQATKAVDRGRLGQTEPANSKGLRGPERPARSTIPLDSVFGSSLSVLAGTESRMPKPQQMENPDNRSTVRPLS